MSALPMTLEFFQFNDAASRIAAKLSVVFNSIKTMTVVGNTCSPVTSKELDEKRPGRCLKSEDKVFFVRVDMPPRKSIGEKLLDVGSSLLAKVQYVNKRAIHARAPKTTNAKSAPLSTRKLLTPLVLTAGAALVAVANSGDTITE